MKEFYYDYYTHYSRLNRSDEKGFESASRAFSYWYKRFLPKNKDTKILDIGCGMGHFLYFLEKEGYKDFVGIDISKTQIEFCKNKITKKALVADVYDFLKSGEKFDIIVTNDVIEHQPKERLLDFLGLIFKALNKGGTLIIKTDNMSNPFGLRGRYMDITHEIGFTEHSLREVLETAGFEKVSMIGAFPPVVSIKSFIRRILMPVMHSLLRAMFLVQGYPSPEILTKDIIAISKKN